MNDKLQNVLAELAEKFGTTVEHLWGVLLKQAAISGVMSIVNICFIAAFAYAVYRYGQWFRNKPKDPIAILTLCAGVAVLLGVPSEMMNAVTAFGNPEYWALTRVMR